MDTTTRMLVASLFAAVIAAPAAAQPAPPTPPPPAIAHAFVMPAMPAMPALPSVPAIAGGGWKESADDKADDLYDRARDLIEQGKFDRAVAELDRLIGLKSNRTDGAIFWKAYSLSKLGQRAEALTSLTDLYKQFGDSRWIRDAKALEVEVRQASGQTVSPASQDDEELKLMALRGIMQSDPEQAYPVIEKMLASANSQKVKDRALFVLSQSRGARAREIIANVAKGNANPDLQLMAIQYLGMMNSPENRQMLADIYKSSPDLPVKKKILRSFMTSGDKEHLAAVAKTEAAPELRSDAVMQLGAMHAGAELSDLYKTETSVDVKRRIIMALSVADSADRVIEIAKSEKDPGLRSTAIRNLGTMHIQGTAEALVSIYASDASPGVRKAVINGLFIGNNAKALVDLARAEKSPELKREIVSKLSVMKSKDATDYLMELLK